MKSTKPTLQSNVIIGTATVDVRFEVGIDGRRWEVTGFMSVRTHDFTPELIGSFSVQQFAKDSGVDLSVFVAQLKSMVKGNL